MLQKYTYVIKNDTSDGILRISSERHASHETFNKETIMDVVYRIIMVIILIIHRLAAEG
jgi:hypothetical protein